jgi:uncharacterized glyoxalase superfamily protein PhnB
MPTDALDNLDILRGPDQPVAPPADFAASLRRRVVAAINDIERTAMQTVVQTTVVPYLAAHDARAALAFYAEAFGAVEIQRIVMEEDDRIGHAEFHIGEAVFYISDEYPEIGVPSPRMLGGTPVMLHLTIPGVDEVVARAVAAGATLLRAPEDQPHGSRHGVIADPFGHRWMISTPL